MQYDCERPSFVGMQVAALSPALLSFEHMFGDKNPVMPGCKLAKAAEAAQLRIQRIREELEELEQESAAEHERAAREAETDTPEEAARSAERRARGDSDRQQRQQQLEQRLVAQEELERQGALQREAPPGEVKVSKPVRWLQQVPRN